MIEMKNTPFDIPIFDPTEKVAVITGGIIKLGYDMAVMLCAYGAKAVINGLSEEDRKKIFDEVSVMGGATISFETDVQNHQEVQAMVAKTMETFGKLDIMICNTDIGITRRIMEMSGDERGGVAGTDLKGIFICGTKVAKAMAEKEIKGRVISISSAGGLMGAKNIATYCTSKPDMIGLFRTEAMEWGCYGVTANVICPGYVPTAINSVPLTTPGIEEQILAKTVLKRLGEV